jgi:hypothetical protein
MFNKNMASRLILIYTQENELSGSTYRSSACKFWLGSSGARRFPLPSPVLSEYPAEEFPNPIFCSVSLVDVPPEKRRSDG